MGKRHSSGIKWLLNITILVVFIMILLNFMYLFNGSFEEFPTEEQEEKISIVTSIIGIFLFIIEVILVGLRILIGKLTKA